MSKPRAAAPAFDAAKVWRSIRVMRRFTIDDIAATATAPVDAVRGYVETLRSAGFVRGSEVPVTRKPGRVVVYRLVRDTGARAPGIATMTVVNDPNTGRVWTDTGRVCAFSNGEAAGATRALGRRDRPDALSMDEHVAAAKRTRAGGAS